jgi:hypothetical protein
MGASEAQQMGRPKREEMLPLLKRHEIQVLRRAGPQSRGGGAAGRRVHQLRHTASSVRRHRPRLTMAPGPSGFQQIEATPFSVLALRGACRIGAYPTFHLLLPRCGFSMPLRLARARVR